MQNIVPIDHVKELPDVPEATVVFNVLSDKTTYHIGNRETNQIVAEISGYDLKIGFNLEYIKTLEDVEVTCDGITQMFRNILLDILLADKQKT